MQNRTFRFVVGSGLWTKPHKWLILAHSNHPSTAGAMSPAEMALLAWGLWGREGVLLPGRCAIASKNALPKLVMCKNSFRDLYKLV